MSQIDFTLEETEKLKYERFNHPNPKVQQRMHALYLKAIGFSHMMIMLACGIKSRTTLSTWIGIYKSGGIEALKVLNYKGHPNKLNDYADEIKEYFKNNPPRSINEAVKVIEELIGLKRSPTQVRKFLKKLGFKRLKVGCAPGKELNEEKAEEQKKFLDEELDPRLDEAKEGKRQVLFLDAAHLVHGHFLTVLWCLTRLFIPSYSGRKRFNVLGALDAVTKKVITVCSITNINTESVLAMLDKIKAIYGDGIPITIVLDNAKYQRNKAVMAYAESLGIELLFLPSYSPNLNLIERLWKFVKKECLYGKYYATFEEFKASIEACLNETDTKHKSALQTLLNLKFQFFENVQFLAV